MHVRLAPLASASEASCDLRPADADDAADKAALLATPVRPRLSRGVTWRRPYQLQRTAACRADSQLLRCFAQFVSIPTVSGDPELHEECFRGAKYLASLLEGMGMQAKLAAAENTVHPCVLARLEVAPDLPTLVFYGHYDVQPAQELVRPCYARAWDESAGAASVGCRARAACRTGRRTPSR